MEEQKVYHCKGRCMGVAKDPCKCGDTSCEHWNRPLNEYRQCAVCAARTTEDGMPHMCINCKEV